MTAVITRPPVEKLTPATCWCERSTVMVPVQWVSEARTGSCGPGCGPGCPSRSNDDDYDDDPTEVARTGKKIKMKRFNATTYDPRVDSSAGYANGGVRVSYPRAVILEAVSVGDSIRLCGCGCAESPRGRGAVFGMGHDARLRGKLARAHAAGCPIVLTDAIQTVHEELSALDYAKRFSTDKLDWQASILDSVSRVKSGVAAEEQVLAKALGPRVGDEKLIRVGRWDKTGKIVAVYEDRGEIRYEYVDAKGNVRQAIQGADGKVREVKDPS